MKFANIKKEISPFFSQTTQIEAFSSEEFIPWQIADQVSLLLWGQHQQLGHRLIAQTFEPQEGLPVNRPIIFFSFQKALKETRILVYKFTYICFQ